MFDDNIVFAQSYFDVSDRNHYFPNTGISSLGHAIPAAIGARCFAPDSPTFAILGDGGFQMCCMEMMTAVNYGIPLNVVVINNGTLCLIRKNQFQLYGERYIDCDFTNPDFGLLAQSFGVRHYPRRNRGRTRRPVRRRRPHRCHQPHRNPARQACLPPLPVGALAWTARIADGTAVPEYHGGQQYAVGG